ncbi:type II toxin-antitoxin system HicB family antitoxin [Actinomadura sp. ATCC 31491]|uniref:Type II toxin-antitoxin system HicB family antitoxin n=1 Tax=Actinomadura luzonensis TaxID=2805427 RepID=A0ABT0G9B7_9ACTN|nr:toxin-antitoxin system HicB family antitoxin [Actinomadura luzonensis]MCK2220983.1 type II toxin-antitoxin system HicB family antitoxin [Actinomadura luzonensis]
MDLKPYVDRLRRDLAIAAEAGGDDARALAERLTSPLEASLRLVLLEVLSAAADEITRELAPGSVEVRLRRGDPDFVLTPPPSALADAEPLGPATTAAPTGVAAPATGEAGGTARINLRLPEHLKSQVEEAARQEGLSVNTWLVRALAATLDAGRRPSGGRATTPGSAGSRYTGWVG